MLSTNKVAYLIIRTRFSVPGVLATATVAQKAKSTHGGGNLAPLNATIAVKNIISVCPRAGNGLVVAISAKRETFHALHREADEPEVRL